MMTLFAHRTLKNLLLDHNSRDQDSLAFLLFSLQTQTICVPARYLDDGISSLIHQKTLCLGVSPGAFLRKGMLQSGCAEIGETVGPSCLHHRPHVRDRGASCLLSTLQEKPLSACNKKLLPFACFLKSKLSVLVITNLN